VVNSISSRPASRTERQNWHLLLYVCHQKHSTLHPMKQQLLNLHPLRFMSADGHTFIEELNTQAVAINVFMICSMNLPA
jgi:hypothetical protein